jgi:hypothetical protein
VTAVVIVIAIGCVVLLAVRREARSRPSAIATRRLDAQIAQVEQQLAALRPVHQDFAAEQEDRVRAQWLRDQLAATPVEAIEVPGTGPSTHKALRASGIACLGDLPKLGPYGVKVPSVGLKREEHLLAAYRDAHRRLSTEAARMQRAALDAYSRGALGAVLARHDAEELDRRRKREAAELRLRDLHRRRATL